MSIKVNGIKKITNLTAATTINDADVFMIETSSGSRKVTGATLKTLINNAANSAADGVEAIIAPQFDASNSYVTGDYVLNGGKLYRFTADHATGAFDGTDAVEVTVADDMVSDVTVNGTSVVNNGVANIPALRGEKGDKGDTYSLTTADKEEIVTLIPTATTATNGVMSSTDKQHLDDVYADYSSALTALGVI